MNKFLKILVVSGLFVFLSAACSNGSSTEGFEEYPDDGSEQFINIGNSYENDSNKGDSHAGEAADTENSAPYDTSSDADPEIVESDIYKFDGDILWLANKHKGLIAVDIKDPENLKILGNLRFQGYVGEMYIQEGRAYILVSYNDWHYEDDDFCYSGRTYSKLLVVDIEDPTDLRLIGEFQLEGLIRDSRQVGDIIYVASNEETYLWKDFNGNSGNGGQYQISVMSVNIKDPQNIKMVDKVIVPGVGYGIYVSQKSIYIAEPDLDYYMNKENKSGFPVIMFDISDPEGKIVKKAEFRTDGFMSDRWKMHEEGNIFFAVGSSTSWSNSESMIESFDVSDPENIKKLDKLVFMTGQQLYGTKFEGDRMYAVTYFQRDPLHVIDISDPENLRELGELEVPGWSDFIEVKGKTILAVGRGDSKTKVSMYNVADPENPKEINTVEVGSNYSYSEANSDWKAFQIFDDLGLILLPITDYNKDSCEITYKLYLIDFDPDKGLTTRGFITSDSYVRRGVAVQDLIFSICDKHLVLADATDRDNPKVLSDLTVAPYLSNITKCGEALCGLDDYNNFNVYDKTMGKTLWTTSLPKNALYSYRDTYLMKNSRFAYIYHNDYNSTDDGNRYAFRVVKFNENGSFEEVGDFETGSDELNQIQAVSENNVIASLEIIDNWSDESNSRQYQIKIRLLDMNDPKNGIKSTNFDYDYRSPYFRSSLFAVKNTFWTSGCILKNEDQENGDEYLCYALPFNVSDPKNPKEDKRVNITGELVGISDDAKYFYTATPVIFNEEDDTGNYEWTRDAIFDFYVLKLGRDRTTTSVVAKETLHDHDSYDLDKNYENLENYVYVKNDKVFFVKIFTEQNWRTCPIVNRGTTEVRIVSAENGQEIYKKSFENTNFIMSVQNGGVLLPTPDGWTYIDPDGMEKSGNQNISSLNGLPCDDLTCQGISHIDYYNKTPLLIDGTVYIAAGWDGIYALDVK